MRDTDYDRNRSDRQHLHHWLIEEASGPVSRGICRGCKEEREFRNWLPELEFITRTERAIA